MLRYVLASHGELARGMCDSVRMLLGESVELWPVCAYVQADEPISEQIEAAFARFSLQDDIIVMTDLFGGSVNTTFAQLLQKRNFYLVTGVNLGLVIDLLTIDGRNIEEEIRFVVERNRKAMQFCNPLFESVKNSVAKAQNV